MVINGERVKQSRELKGMTQSALAALVGKTQSAIAQIESGLCSTSEATATLIAQHTSQPINFFTQDAPPDFPEGSLLFRAHASVTKHEMNLTQRYAQWAFEIYMKLSSRVRKIPVSLEAMRGTDAISAARQARRALELPPSEPVPHLLSVMEWHGVIGLVLPNIKSRDAFSVWLNRSPVIAISAGRAGDCTRMSVSHELGHLLMHAGKSRFEVKEAEAEEFAAEFLMPQSAMRKEIRLPVTLSSLADLKPRWKVPLQVLIRRAKGLDIITERQSRYLTDKCSDLARGNLDPYRISEEKPRALRQLAEMLYGDPIDYQTMANDLAVNADHLIEMLEQCAAKHESRLPTRPISTMPRRHRT